MKDHLAFQRSARLSHTRAYFTSPDATTPRNITTEMLQTLAGNKAVAAPQYALESQYQPLYGQLALRNQAQTMQGYTDDQGVYHPGSLQLGRTGATFQRAGDISDVQTLGPQAYAALLNANPLLNRSLTELTGRVGDSDILRKLNLQANTALDSGGALTPQEQRSNVQGTRAAFADRGTLMGNQAIGTELLNRDAAVRARLQQNQQFATGVQGLNQSQNDFAGRVAQIAGSQFDPFMAIMNRSSGGASGGGTPQQIGTGAQLFNPMNPYAQDIYSSNQTAEAAHNAASAQAQNANTSAAISIATALAMAGIAASDERLKKNVKKTGEKTADEIPIVEFTYKTDPAKKRWRGVMAQAVEKVRPQNVITDPRSGIKLVDYWGLGMEPLEVAA